MKRYRKQTASSSNGSFWLSFSDMMSVLVLIFIFVIFSMMFTLNECASIRILGLAVGFTGKL